MAVEFIIGRVEEFSTHQVALVFMSDGHRAAAAEVERPADEDVSAYVAANKVQLFSIAPEISMQSYRAVQQRAADPVINSAINAAFTVFATQAEPTVAAMVTAATDAIAGTPKEAELAKITNWLVNMSDEDFRRFVALIVMISMSKSGRG